MSVQGIEGEQPFVKIVDIQAQRRRIGAAIRAAMRDAEQVTLADSDDVPDQPNAG